jgi:hypothetical protein
MALVVLDPVNGVARLPVSNLDPTELLAQDDASALRIGGHDADIVHAFRDQGFHRAASDVPRSDRPRRHRLLLLFRLAPGPGPPHDTAPVRHALQRVREEEDARCAIAVGNAHALERLQVPDPQLSIHGGREPRALPGHEAAEPPVDLEDLEALPAVQIPEPDFGVRGGDGPATVGE